MDCFSVPILIKYVLFSLFQATDESIDRVDETGSPGADSPVGLATGPRGSADGRDTVAGARQSHNLRDAVQRSEDARAGGQGLDICGGGCK